MRMTDDLALPPQILVFCCAHAEQVEQHLKAGPWMRLRSVKVGLSRVCNAVRALCMLQFGRQHHTSLTCCLVHQMPAALTWKHCRVCAAKCRGICWAGSGTNMRHRLYHPRPCSH